MVQSLGKRDWDVYERCLSMSPEAVLLHNLRFSSCLQVPALSFCPGFPQWWLVTWNCKPNKLFPPQVALGRGVYHSSTLGHTRTYQDWLCSCFPPCALRQGCQGLTLFIFSSFHLLFACLSLLHCWVRKGCFLVASRWSVLKKMGGLQYCLKLLIHISNTLTHTPFWVAHMFNSC